MKLRIHGCAEIWSVDLDMERVRNPGEHEIYTTVSFRATALIMRLADWRSFVKDFRNSVTNVLLLSSRPDQYIQQTLHLNSYTQLAVR